VVAFPDGAEDKYWHDRDSGAWGTYVLDEVIPQVAERLHTDDRVAIGGISMGGFGAYDLAQQSPRRFCAVGGHSPALCGPVARPRPARSTTPRTSPATT
jgi:S-formylglutathione hydrolase FrmB